MYDILCHHDNVRCLATNKNVLFLDLVSLQRLSHWPGSSAGVTSPAVPGSGDRTLDLCTAAVS